MWQTTELTVFSRWLWLTSYIVDSHVDQFRNQSLRPSAPSASTASGGGPIAYRTIFAYAAYLDSKMVAGEADHD